MLLVALVASVFSTLCGIAYIVYRYESRNAKRKLAAQLAITLVAEAKNSAGQGSEGGQHKMSQPQLSGLLQSDECINAVIREAARQSAVFAGTGIAAPNDVGRTEHRSSELLDSYLSSQLQAGLLSAYGQPLDKAHLYIQHEVSFHEAFENALEVHRDFPVQLTSAV